MWSGGRAPALAAARRVRGPPFRRWEGRHLVARARAPWGRGYWTLAVLRRRALPMTLTEESAMAAAAIAGESNSPATG